MDSCQFSLPAAEIPLHTILLLDPVDQLTILFTLDSTAGQGKGLGLRLLRSESRGRGEELSCGITTTHNIINQCTSRAHVDAARAPCTGPFHLGPASADIQYTTQGFGCFHVASLNWVLSLFWVAGGRIPTKRAFARTVHQHWLVGFVHSNIV